MSLVFLLLAAVVRGEPGIPSQALAQGEPRWIAYFWIAGMAALAMIVVWTAATGRLIRRKRNRER